MQYSCLGPCGGSRSPSGFSALCLSTWLGSSQHGASFAVVAATLAASQKTEPRHTKATLSLLRPQAALAGSITACLQCCTVRPERGHHCNVCSHCVLRMDHHCPWIGNCVGSGNHKYFLLFGFWGFWASGVSCISMRAQLVGLWLYAVLGRPWPEHVMPSLETHSLSIFILGVALTMLKAIMFCGFCASQTYLLVQNRTTAEVDFSGKSPYDVGALQNAEQLFGAAGVMWLLPVPPTEPVSDGITFPLCPESSQVPSVHWFRWPPSWTAPVRRIRSKGKARGRTSPQDNGDVVARDSALLSLEVKSASWCVGESGCVNTL